MGSPPPPLHGQTSQAQGEQRTKNYNRKFVRSSFRLELAGARRDETRAAASCMVVTDNLGLPARLPPPALGGGDEHVIFQLHTPSSCLQ